MIDRPNLFNADTELRRLLLGKDPVPFTPIPAFGLPLLADAPSRPPVVSSEFAPQLETVK